jgi:mRNA deadenylase 3'-5' endonuclease subunit Ccr4
MFQKMIRIKGTENQPAPICTFTILTYNCLASNLAEPKYFPKTNPAHLEFSYRSKLSEREFKSFNADIICLQEMHKDNMEQWLCPFLSQLGYDEGTFAERGGTKAKDGVVIFFKRDKFKLLNHHRLGYFDSAQAQFPTQTALATYNAALFCLLQIQNNKVHYTVFGRHFYKIRFFLRQMRPIKKNNKYGYAIHILIGIILYPLHNSSKFAPFLVNLLD